MAKSRLEELYRTKIRPELQKSLGIENINAVPKISKVVLNVGVKEAVNDSKILNHVVDTLERIAGQKAVKTIAKKSIAGFKIREGMPLGAKVTLRRDRAMEYLDRLINLSLPKVRDFQGLPIRFDGRGGYNIGIKEWTIFPEADTTSLDNVYGMNITIQTTASSDEHTLALLQAFGMPFRKTKK
jgi:large subunit ribosomal protein L5